MTIQAKKEKEKEKSVLFVSPFKGLFSCLVFGNPTEKIKPHFFPPFPSEIQPHHLPMIYLNPASIGNQLETGKT